MATLRDRMEADLKIGGYGPSTRKIHKQTHAKDQVTIMR